MITRREGATDAAKRAAAWIDFGPLVYSVVALFVACDPWVCSIGEFGMLFVLGGGSGGRNEG